MPEQPVTEKEIDETFKPGSETIQKIESAISKQAFETLLAELKDFVNVSTTNAELKAFQTKVKGYNQVKTLENTGTKWTKESFTNVAQDKSWSIEFSTPVANSDKDKIDVVDIFNVPLAVSYKFTTSKVTNDTLTITPTKNYEAGAEYYVVIPAGTKSTDGVILKETVYVPFTVK